MLADFDIKKLINVNPMFRDVSEFIQKEPIRGNVYFYSNVFSEDGKIKPTPSVIYFRAKSFEEVAQEIDQRKLPEEKKWRKFLQLREEWRNHLLEKIIEVIDDHMASGNIEIGWTRLWGEVNRKLDPNCPFKDGYSTKTGNKYPSKDAIAFAERFLTQNNERNSTGFYLEKNGKGYTIGKLSK